MCDATSTARQELAALLRTRRESLQPAHVGLPPRVGASRTPGLRREEVAALAGVSVDYLTRLEQARDAHPSPGVAEALAAALRFDDDQREYLFVLAGHRAPQRSVRTHVPPSLTQLVDDMSPRPAMIVNHRLDILAWNDVMAALLLDLDEQPPHSRNVLRMCFLDERFRGFYGARDEVIRGAVADLRAAWATHASDTILAGLIDELEQNSAEFAEYWRSRAVAVRSRGHKPMKHPAVGDLTVTFEVLNPLGDNDLRLIIYRAADGRSQVALDELTRSSARTPKRHLRAL